MPLLLAARPKLPRYSSNVFLLAVRQFQSTIISMYCKKCGGYNPDGLTLKACGGGGASFEFFPPSNAKPLLTNTSAIQLTPDVRHEAKPQSPPSSSANKKWPVIIEKTLVGISTFPLMFVLLKRLATYMVHTSPDDLFGGGTYPKQRISDGFLIFASLGAAFIAYKVWGVIRRNTN